MIEVGVVVQTHWDREWYFTREQFVARLLRVLPRVLDDLDAGRLQHFLFDGQVAALEDLLERAEPALVARTLAAVKAGRVQIGPWYVMADEFLCAGESLWRNLEIGIGLAREHGSSHFVGYLPDSFGHIAQMPQLLRHFGIDHAVLWRGVDSSHSEFDWIAPDGSVVPALFLPEGYYQHPFNLPEGEWQTALSSHLDRIAPRATTGRLLLTQGGDHLLPRREFAERLATFNASQSKYRLVETTLPAHAAAVLSEGQRQGIEGELRNNAQAFVLPDVLSTRRDLKLAHDRLQDRLLYEIEPLFARLNVPWPERALGQVWRTLLQQQAHDSICGCSVDAVHLEMHSRFVQLDQRLDELRRAALLDAGMVGEFKHDGPNPWADDSRFTLFNPLPVRRQAWHPVELFLAGSQAPTGVLVRNQHGECLPSRLRSVTPASEFRSPLDDFPDPVHGHRLQLEIEADLAGWQALSLTLETADAAAHEEEQIDLDAEGRLRLNGLPIAIQTELDAGDSYNFSPPPQRCIQRHERFTRLGPNRFGIEVRMPAGLNADRSGPSEAQVLCSGELELRPGPFAGSFVQARLRWHNTARDQRTRLLVGLPLAVTESYADSGFAWLRRPVLAADYPSEPSRREMPVAVQPSYSALAMGGVHFAHRAMPEYEWLPQSLQECPETLAVTLVRSVGWLSRRDLVTRGVGAGPDLATPDAQCLGTQVFDFSLAHLSEPQHERLLSQAQALRQPVLALRGHGQAWHEAQTLPDSCLQVSAVRRTASGLELRLWNPSQQTQPCALPGWTGPSQAAPHQIVTLTR